MRSRVLPKSAIYARALAAALVATLAVGIATRAQAQSARDNANGAQERATFWLVDKQGWRIPLPNWTIEDIARAIDSRAETTQTPLYSIQRLKANGRVVDGIARLTIRLSVAVADGVVRVPLGLQEGVYIPTGEESDAASSGFSYVGPGLCAFDVDAHTGEYSAVIHTSRADRSITRGQEDDSAPSSAESDAEKAEHENNVASAPTPDDVEQEASDSSADGAQAPQDNVDETHNFDLERIVETLPTADRGDSRELVNQYELELQLSFVIEKTSEDKVAAFVDANSDATEYRFAASFPPSLHSDLTLEAPPYDIELTTVKGAAANAPTPLDESYAQMKLRGLGRGGERVEITWRKQRKAQKDDSEGAPAVLQVENALITAELSARDVSYNAALPIKSFGKDSELFQILLPRGATVAADNVSATDANGAKFEIRAANVKDMQIEGRDEKVLEIQLAQATKAATINLKTHAPNTGVEEEGLDVERDARDIMGFAVLGAQKQFGRVKISKSPDAFFNVAPIYGVASASDEIHEEGEEVYSFFSQPFLLRAEKYERATIVNVKPEYLLNVGYDDQTLRARFQYSVYGSKVKELKARLNGWYISEMTDAKNVVNQYAIREEEGGDVVIPLNAPTNGEITFEMTLKRAPDNGGANATSEENAVVATPNEYASTQMTAVLPTPIANRVEPGALVVSPENAVEFTPRPDACSGLVVKTARSMTLALEQPKTSRTTTFYYQTRSFGGANDANSEEIKIVADLRKLRQELEAFVKSDATLSEKGVVRVTETMTYKIEREPLEYLTFTALSPLAELIENRAVKCFVDGKQQNIVEDLDAEERETADATDKQDAEREEFFKVALDAPKIGSCVVTFQYEQPSFTILERATNRFRVLLFQPPARLNDVEIKTKNELTLTAPLGYEIEYQEWKPEEGPAFWLAERRALTEDSRAEIVRCKSHMPELFASFKVALGMEATSTIIDRAWIQSWITSSMRVDRAAYRVSCKRSTLEVRLPDRATLDRVAVALNGNLMPIASELKQGVVLDGRVARIPISDELKKSAFLLEISYNAPSRFGPRGRCDAQFPKFLGDSVWTRRTYWQIVMRYDRHIITDPKNWTAEFVVKRGGWVGVYQRFPTMSQEELAQWVGVAKTEPLPEEANVYLYSAFGDGADEREAERDANLEQTSEVMEETAPTVVFYVVDRAALVLFGSGAALIIGLSLTYIPVFRSKVALFLIALVVLAVSALRPLVALLFLQTTVLGVALAFAALAISKVTTQNGNKRANNHQIAALNEQKKRAAEQAIVKE